MQGAGQGGEKTINPDQFLPNNGPESVKSLKKPAIPAATAGNIPRFAAGMRCTGSVTALSVC
jgi:hypothetical protein